MSTIGKKSKEHKEPKLISTITIEQGDTQRVVVNEEKSSELPQGGTNDNESNELSEGDVINDETNELSQSDVINEGKSEEEEELRKNDPLLDRAKENSASTLLHLFLKIFPYSIFSF